MDVFGRIAILICTNMIISLIEITITSMTMTTIVIMTMIMTMDYMILISLSGVEIPALSHNYHRSTLSLTGYRLLP